MKSYNPFFWLIDIYVKRSKKFDKPSYVLTVDGDQQYYCCPVCGWKAGEPWKICEKCFYPLPIIGGSKPK